MMMSGVAVVSLLVAAVGILASLYTAVLERTKEIGLLKALGMKNRFLVTFFLNEALIIGLIGGAVGNIAGVGLAHILAILIAKSREASATELITLGYAPPIFTVDIFLTVLAFTVALSMVSGMYPAWRAAGLDPVVALRKE
jgi:putative ABC transport system permease protein